MHDGHVHGSCGDCAGFVPAFPAKAGLDGWGYCHDQAATPPPPAALTALHDAFRDGDRTPLRQNQFGLYRSEPDDACDFYRERPS
jgi:hypothetical protein